MCQRIGNMPKACPYVWVKSLLLLIDENAFCIEQILVKNAQCIEQKYGKIAFCIEQMMDWIMAYNKKWGPLVGLPFF